MLLRSFSRATALAALSLLPFSVAAQQPGQVSIPAAPREFRGAWVATVANIDWPSKKTLNTKQQRNELIRLLDRARAMNLNAIVFQVRPAADALYRSNLEPWSEFLTGQQGKSPMPEWDPLQVAVEEAHKRGIELHAWFNPYRASHPSMKGELAPNHISKTRPDLVRQYGNHMWLDPGEKEVQDHTFNVIMDVVSRYDIDGVHFDDYFYPYKSYAKGADFPDDPSWQKYLASASGAKMSRGDWRRENVNILIRRVSEGIRATRPHVKFGISPFGIWKPGYPSGISGLNAYEELYKDSRKWIQEGWVDYISPQLYWKISAPQQSYPVLLKWWVEQNLKGYHVWPGLIPSSVGKGKWAASEIVNQILATRKQPGATGNILFSMKPLMRDQGGVRQALETQVYAGKALVPASPWLENQPPPAPDVRMNRSGDDWQITWTPGQGERPFVYAVYARMGNAWRFDILPAGQTSLTVPGGADAPAMVAVSAVDRVGNESPRALATGGGAQ